MGRERCPAIPSPGSGDRSLTSNVGNGQRLDFDKARRIAAVHRLPDYLSWRSGLERRYSVMPPWYWNESVCRQNYAAHIQSISDWQENQAQINAGLTAFHQGLRRGP